MGNIVVFHDTMEQFSNLTGEQDKVVWKIGSKGVFSVKSAYKDLNHSNSNDRKELWPWQMIWKPKIPYKVNHFTWLLAKEVVLTQKNIKKRKFLLCSRCYLCEEHAETVDHLFLHCKWTDQLWRIFSSLRKITWVKPRNIVQLLNCWINIGNTTIKEER